MKRLLFIILITLLFSCEKPDICWECKAIIYQKEIRDIVCYKNITDIEDYKARLYEFYDGGCISVECELLSDTYK